MFSKLLLAAALVGVANAQTCADIDGAGGGALSCLTNSVTDTGATTESCEANPCTNAADNDKCCTASDGYFSDATDAAANVVTQCTTVTNAADPTAVTCTTATNSQMTGACAAGYNKNTDATADACDANTCTAKADAAAWAALGVTVTTAGATTVAGLGTIGKATNYFGSATVTCPTDGGDFLVGGVTACTEVANAADPKAVTCTDANDSQLPGACATGYTKNTGGTADACDANTCTGGGLTQPSNGVETGTVPGSIDTGTDVTAYVVGATGYTCTGTALAVCTTAGANAVTTTGRTCAVTLTTTAAPTTTPEPEPETPAPAPATLPENSASTCITSAFAGVTVIAAALAGL